MTRTGIHLNGGMGMARMTGDGKKRCLTLRTLTAVLPRQNWGGLGLWVLGAWVVVMLASAWPAQVQAAEATYVVRPAEVKRKGTQQWVVLNQGDTVNAGDTIRTGEGARVEVRLSPKRVFRIGQITEIEMPQLSDNRQQGVRAKFNLLLGRFWGGLVQPMRDVTSERFEVSTATATIGVKGTSFGVDYNKKTDASSVLVIDGTVVAVPPGQEPELPVEIAGPREIAPPQEISRDEWLLLVTRDQKVTIRPGEVPQVEPLTDEDKADDWVKFNTDRDDALARQ